MGKASWIPRQHSRRIESWMSTDGVEQIGRERHVQHLFDENTGDDLGGFRIAEGVKRVQRAQVGWQREVFEFDRPLQRCSSAQR